MKDFKYAVLWISNSNETDLTTEVVKGCTLISQLGFVMYSCCQISKNHCWNI